MEKNSQLVCADIKIGTQSGPQLVISRRETLFPGNKNLTDNKTVERGHLTYVHVKLYTVT